MYFDDEFIKTLPVEPFEAIEVICEKYSRLEKKSGPSVNLAIETCALIHNYNDAYELKIEIPNIPDQGSLSLNRFSEAISTLRHRSTKDARGRQLEHYKTEFGVKIGTKFHYEFSEGDLKKIQELLNQLRSLISDSTELDEDQRNRLLKRLEKLQSELHKKVSDLDRFWGFFIDASIVVRIMGENAKPMIEVIQKIVRIIWPTQTRAYELPSDLPFKLLGQSEEEKSK